MPKAADIIKDHEHRIKVLEQHVFNLLAAATAGDIDLEEEIELDDDVPGAKVEPPSKPQRKAIKLEGLGDSSDVVIPEATEEQARMRHSLIPLINLGGLPKQHGLDKEPAEEAYLTGGPYWLYLFDRDYVMGLPPEAKQAMYQDLLIDDVRRATDFARDVLKEEVELGDGQLDATLAARGT